MFVAPCAASERRSHREAAEAKRRSRPKGGLTPTGRRGLANLILRRPPPPPKAAKRRLT